MCVSVCVCVYVCVCVCVCVCVAFITKVRGPLWVIVCLREYFYRNDLASPFK